MTVMLRSTIHPASHNPTAEVPAAMRSWCAGVVHRARGQRALPHRPAARELPQMAQEMARW
eukprot:9727088-Alexandrium_andersonii.AAC.1